MDLTNSNSKRIRQTVSIILIFICTFVLTTLSSDPESVQPYPETLLQVNNEDLLPVLDKDKLDPQSSESISSNPTTTKEDSFVKLYQDGVTAYENELWYACADKIENSIRDYHLYKRALTDCRLDCETGVRSSKLSNISSQFENFSIYFKFLQLADCFRRCREESLTTRPKVTERLENLFEERVPYSYLQFCYYKLERLKLASSASYTYLLRHPNDTDTIHNIKFYREGLGMRTEDFQDLEMVPYKEHYIQAVAAYRNEDWQAVIDHIEKSLEEYFMESKRCQVDCQGKSKMKGREFTTGMADLIFEILTCRLDCEEKLSIIYSEPTPLFLQTLFHYLNFAYYMLGDLQKSAEASASFLLLNSTSKVVLENKRVLQEKLGYSDEDIKPSRALSDYLKERKDLVDIMDAVVKNYKFADVTMDAPDDEDTFEYEKEEEEQDDWMTRYEKLGMHLIARAKDLNRDGRFVTDGLLKPEQCEELLLLADGVEAGPDGSLKFDLTEAKKRLEANPDEDFEASLRLFVRAAEVIRHYTQRYLGGGAIYLKHTELICWDSSAPKSDCYKQEDGSCIEPDGMSTELLEDGFSTVTYLNSADEDGDFQFLNEKKEVDTAFGVKCGRTVGFREGDRHTLNIPQKSKTRRCSMHIVYTVYRSHDEREYQELIGLLHKVDQIRMDNALKNSEEVMKDFKDKGVEISRTGEDLHGKERVVFDGFATDSQCDTMKNMVLELGKSGDGYGGKRTPHTVNEMFAGLTLEQVAQSGALVGDGYDHLDNKPSFISPHTEHERYQGITIYRAAKLSYSGLVSAVALKSFLDLSENARLMVERYFNLTKPLYFDYTHLVCRTAIDDTKFNRQDLSHPVHSDNCVLKPDGTCSKEYPAFTQRDYSAVLYLNNEFEGGEFFFAHANKSEQVSVRPKCGRLVAFNAGEFHGVKAVKSGHRCALALWFTHNSNFKEISHVHARKVLKQIEEQQKEEEEKVREDL